MTRLLAAKLPITLLLAGLFLSALAAAPSAPVPAPSDQDKVVELNPFEVSASNRGYLGAESTTGTLYAAPINEIPFPVQIITAEQIEDYQAFDLAGQSAFKYSGSFSNAFPQSSTGVIVLRGIRGFAIYKNGIREGGVYGPASIDRIELIEGENDSIYGQGEPSGAINRVTKEGQATPFQSLTVSAGDDHYSRTMLDVNQPIIAGKLLFRMAGSYENSDQFAQRDMHFNRQNLYASATYKFAKNLVWTVHSEYVVPDSTSQGAFQMPFYYVPVNFNGTVTNQVEGQFGQAPFNSKFDRTLNLNGPFSYNKVRYNQNDTNLVWAHEHWTAMLLGNYWRRGQENPQMKTSGSNANQYNVATGQLQASDIMQDQANHQFQVNGKAYVLGDFVTGPVHQKLLIMGDYVKSEVNYNYAAQSSLPFATTPINNFLLGETSAPGFPYAIDFGNAAIWNKPITNQRSLTVDKGALISERLGFFGDRLLLIAGTRHDQVDQSLINYLASTTISTSHRVVPAGQLVDYPIATAQTIQSGAVFKITPGLSAFADYATDFVPQAANIPPDANGDPIAPVRGSGDDLGLKADLFDHKVSFTTDVYQALRKNLAIAATGPSGTALTLPGTSIQYSNGYSERTYGWEVQGTYNPTANLSFQGGIGWNKAWYSQVYNATTAYQLGLPVDATPHWSGGLAGKYYFSGRLKGLYMFLGVSGQDRELVNVTTYSIFGNSNYRGVPIPQTGQPTHLFEDAGWLIWNPAVGYRWQSGRVSHALSVNINNVFNKMYFVGPNIMEGIAGNITYTIKR